MPATGAICVSDILQQTNRVLSEDFSSEDNLPIGRLKECYEAKTVRKNLTNLYISSDDVPLAQLKSKQTTLPKK